MKTKPSKKKLPWNAVRKPKKKRGSLVRDIGGDIGGDIGSDFGRDIGGMKEWIKIKKNKKKNFFS